MTDIFMLEGLYGEPSKIFSTWKRAEAEILNKFRNSHASDLTIDRIVVDYSIGGSYKYSCTHKFAGNIHFLRVEFAGRLILEEAQIVYSVHGDRQLVSSQLEEYSDHSPRWIYFNQKSSVKNGYKSYCVGKVQNVTDPEIAKYFKYKAYCCADHKNGKKIHQGGY